MFHPAACCACLKLFFPPINIQHTQCLCRFVVLATKALLSQASRQTYIYIYTWQIQQLISTHYLSTWYAHACCVRVVQMEQGGGALGIFKPPVCTYLYNQSRTFCQLHICTVYILPPWSKRSGRRMPPAKRSALYERTWIFFLSGLRWHLPGLSQAPT